MAKFPMYDMAGVGIAAAVGFVLILSSISSNIPVGPITPIGGPSGPTGPITFVSAGTQELKKFSSVQEMTTFLASIESSREAFVTLSGGIADEGIRLGVADLTSLQETQGPTTAPSAPAAESAESDGAKATPDYSTTNVQVVGVDEPDFVKNDGKYAYVLSGDRLTIAEVYPAESAKVVAKVGLDIQQGQYLQNMFINNNTLVVFYQEYAQEDIIPQYDIIPQPFYAPKTHVMILDVTDRSDPRVAKDYVVTGAYSDARMMGDYVYLVTTSDLYNYRQPLLPKVAEAGATVVMPDIYYFDNPEPYYNFNTVTSVNIKASEDAVNSQTFMMNPASTLYVSENNIYIAYQKYLPYYYDMASRERFFDAVVPLLPGDVQEEIRSIDADQSLSEVAKWDRIATVLQDMYNYMSEQEKSAFIERVQEALADYDERVQKESHRTVLHKIAIGSAGEIDYVARGEVPGRLLNQFSMDEQGDRFRVATTVEYYSRYSSGLYNNVYVLDGDMQVVGKLEEIAPDESIYSARFIGDRLYLVTFERIDPFFVIDLSTDQPKVLGELKLPGYSSYLHPYDEDHIIGIGKDTKENEFGGVQTTGVKVALFDVSDVSNPRLVDDYLIGDTGTDTDVLWDHKAFLFDREKDVLSIPITSYDYEAFEGERYIEPKAWRGFYVFSTSPDAGFTLKGTVEHSSSTGDYYYYGIQSSRSFYIGDVLYTLSLGNTLKMNDIDTLDAINELEVGSTGGIIPYPEPLPAEPSSG